MQSKEQVVVTGIGLVTPLGCDYEKVWELSLSGNNGVIKLEKSYEALMKYGIHVGGVSPEVSFDKFKGLDKRKKLKLKKLNKSTKMLVYSGLSALEDADLDINVDSERYNIGAIVGTGTALDSLYDDVEVDERNPKWFLETYPNMMLGYLSIAASLKGYGTTIVNACVGGTQAIGEAFKKIQNNEEQLMLAGGVDDKLSKIYASGFSRLNMSSNNTDPESAIRPFDCKRDGFVIGQGACILVLESLSHAKKRGAKIKGKIVGYGNSMDATSISDTSSDGKARAMTQALADANLNAKDIGYINAHGTSTRINDKEESIAIKKVFGEDAYNIPISSTKSLIGHTFAACGAIQSFICIKSLQDQKVHINRNYDTGDDYCDLNYLRNNAVDVDMKYCICNTSGLGGYNSSLIFQKI
ncbi:beta-ketoacyl-[acyl-carrier-protein] synthase family protein [Clostridium felsineum]|uniref:beta-ketoacyl-[acyl-carrier-protein] synthase family protein n=1 Tax=Clostridium felsineum TaxID=36839 RepID=UPI00098BCF10|nr:beta-ketoacyl-[acyl-carrier-protein] synthase family protein [Clostridium felsineum]URZ16106.1 3-oxoacyl-[acyl-carrier-protein] synthase 2 [Clostridium felsineum DSM 794]